MGQAAAIEMAERAKEREKMRKLKELQDNCTHPPMQCVMTKAGWLCNRCHQIIPDEEPK